ncbi:MAG: hypothetical protein ACI8RZ_003191 [Myxococcota bacterium]|jgi:hypothetical protein
MFRRAACLPRGRVEVEDFLINFPTVADGAGVHRAVQPPSGAVPGLV